MRTFKFCLLAAACALFVVACAEDKTTVSNTNAAAPAGVQTTGAANQAAAAADELAETKKTYARYCANCHKEDGAGGRATIEGKTIDAEDLRADKMKKMSDAKYVEYIANGVPDEGMPAFKGRLTDEQIKNLVAYIRREFQQ